jgi:uncharacterized membrane protein (DUF373 family)
MKSPRRRWHVESIGVLELLEDGIYIVVAAVLVLGAIFMLWSALVGFYQDLVASLPAFTVVLDLLDKGLLLFIIAELLHTVRITIQERTLVAEPFLVVGLIAGVRRLLILTAQAAQSPNSFHWNPQGIELTLVIGLILVMTLAVLLWRRLYVPDHERR